MSPSPPSPPPSPPPPWQETIKEIVGQSTHKDEALERDIQVSAPPSPPTPRASSFAEADARLRCGPQDLLSNVGRSGLGIEPPDDIHPWGG